MQDMTRLNTRHDVCEKKNASCIFFFRHQKKSQKNASCSLMHFDNAIQRKTWRISTQDTQHDSFQLETWLIQLETWLISTWEMTHFNTRHATWLTPTHSNAFQRISTHFNARHDVFQHKTRIFDFKVRRDAFSYETWLTSTHRNTRRDSLERILTQDLTHFNVFQRKTWCISKQDNTLVLLSHVNVTHFNSFECETWLISTLLHSRHDSCLHETRPISTHLNTRHDSCQNETALISAHFYARQDSFQHETWLISTQPNTRRDSFQHMSTQDKTWVMSMWGKTNVQSCQRETWRILTRDKSVMSTREVTHFISRFQRETWSILTWDMTHFSASWHKTWLISTHFNARHDASQDKTTHLCCWVMSTW